MPQTSDLNLIGAYPVSVEGKVTFWSDYTKTTQSSKIALVTFTIYMDPCVVDSYTDSVTVTGI